MSTSIARIASYHEPLQWTLRYLLSGLAIAGMAASLNVSTVQASYPLAPLPVGPDSNGRSWGAGLVVASLLAAARQERPIAGIEPAAWQSDDGRPTQR